MGSWVHLNEEGKKLYGTIFPDGVVPVRSPIPTTMVLGGKLQRAFFVNLKELSERQVEALIELLSKRFSAPKNVVKKQIEKDGLPLRANLTSGSGTDQIGLLI